jgi:soluble lytic murein transglycosylase-like protein
VPPHSDVELAGVQTRATIIGRTAALQALVLATAAWAPAANADSFEDRFAPFAHAVHATEPASAADAIALAMPPAGPAASEGRDPIRTLAAYAPSEPQAIFHADDKRFSDGWSIRGLTFGEPAVPGAAAAVALAAPRPVPRGVAQPIAGDTATRIATDASAAPMANDLSDLIARKAEAYGVPLQLAHAVVRVESNYKPTVSGRGGALGLMQIKHATAKGIGFTGTSKELFDPATNLEWGMKYLAGARKLAKGDLCNTVLKYQYGHRAERVTRISTAYCGKVRTYMADTAVAEAKSKTERRSDRRKLAEGPQTLSAPQP